jgi:outer membrane protein, heavy metal efflux system
MIRPATFLGISIALSVLLGMSPVIADDRLAAENLDSLIARALADNPEIKTAEERLGMTTEKARQAGTLEDPMLMFKIQNGLLRDPLAFDREAETAKVIGVTQAIPFYGKRDLRRQGADHDVEADRLRIEERKLELRRMVKETWYRISAVDRSLEVLEKNIGALNDLLRFSETMYGVGKGLQQDVLKAQLERSKMEEMRINLEQKRRSFTAVLNTLAYRPVDAALPVIPAATILPLNLEQQDLEVLAEAHRPALKVQAALIDKTLVTRRLADREIYPDFTISLEYMQREQGQISEGDDMYSASVSFNLPVQHDRRRAMIAEAGAENRMLQEERNMLRNQIRLALAESLAALERNRRLAALYKDGILGQAASVLETTIASYQAGKTDFMKVLDSQMALFNLEREYHEAVAEYQMQMAVLEALVGTGLPGSPE